MDKTSEAFNDFIAALRNGKAFYEEAIDSIDQAVLRNLFRDMIEERESAIAELEKELGERDAEPREEGTFVGEIRQMIAKLRTMMQSPELAYIAELYRLELRTLDKLEECIEAAPTAEAKAVLWDMKSRFRATADTMRGLQVNPEE